MPDLSRPVYAVLGLPFDAVSMAQTVDAVRAAIREKRRLLLSTSNLNFVVAARRNAALRRTVLCSDLNVADGMPIIWVARLLGVPISERVSGSGLFEQLQQDEGPPINVFFFGGPDGVGGEACEKLNRRGGALRCVGYLSPGFGSVEGMSAPEVIDQINAAQPDFLIVSLGAAKGQAWIERNLPRLDAPVVSHLGAVVNFAAGRLQRAPRWMQRVGAEWMWRIKEEPVLAERYAKDAAAFAGLLLREVLPAWLASRGRSLRALQQSSCALEATLDSTAVMVRMLPSSGPLADHQLVTLRKLIATNGKPIRVDLRDMTHLNPRAAAILMLLIGAAMARRVEIHFIGPADSQAQRWQTWFAIPELAQCETSRVLDQV